MQHLLAEVPPQRFAAYLDAERRSGERYLGDTGRVQWLVSFAPIAPAELRAFIGGVSSPAPPPAGALAPPPGARRPGGVGRIAAEAGGGGGPGAAPRAPALCGDFL